MTAEPSAPRSAGRKRDPLIEARATDAAIEVYAISGWQGFTFDAVARVSGVGKPAIYRRWASREALLVDAFDRLNLPTAQDLGSLRADLADYIDQWVTWYQTPLRPQAGSRILIDGPSNPELNRLYADIVTAPRGTRVRDITRRAITRGELPEGTAATAIPDIILGAFFIHWSYSQDRRPEDFHASLASYGARLLETVLAGFTARH
jgi:AcrR family transcriptional regulator